MSSDDRTSKARKIRLVLTDCDGVLTDAGVYYSARGEEMKRFHIRDGMGRRLLQLVGIETGIITGELSESIKRRAERLDIDELHQGIRDKLALLPAICARRGVTPEEIAYMGDDVNDLPLLEKVGLSACPSDAVDQVRRAVNLIVEPRGGQGAFRALADFILASRA